MCNVCSTSIRVHLFIIVYLCKTIEAGTLDCDFDINFCEWKHVTSDDFDWKREKGYTQTGYYTGPKSDHTTGHGHYVYIEASRKYKGAKSRIISPTQSPGQYCLTFWYNMYGIDIGALNVYLARNDNETVIFTKQRDIGNRNWWKSVINMRAAEPYQIIFEGVVGDDIKGDIAIDDISIKSGSCSDCDFDHDFCNWMQYDGDDFNWIRQEGKTLTSNTGPTADHTSGDGYYIYIESSNKNRHDTAIMLSPSLDAGKYCISYWYYMYGSGVDRLRLQLWHTNSSIVTMRTISSAQGQQWLQDFIYVSSQDEFKIAFEGRVKDAGYRIRYKGDIAAVDDVQLFLCHDCIDPTPKHGLTNSTTYEYGTVVAIQCERGYILKGDSLIICEALGQWNGDTACIPYGTENLKQDSSLLVAVYILPPVVVVILAVLTTVVYLRRRHPNCIKMFETANQSKNAPTENSRNGKAHSNQIYNNEAVQLDDEYATIEQDQNKDDGQDTVYYARVKKRTKKEPDKTSAKCVNKAVEEIDRNMFNSYDVLDTGDLSSRKENDTTQDPDYDNACTGKMSGISFNHDDYSHLGDLDTEYQHPLQYGKQTNIQEDTNYSHIDRVNTNSRYAKHSE